MILVPSHIVPGAKIFGVAEAPGENEEVQRTPLVGAAGHVLNGMLSESGLNRHDISFANVLGFRPPGNELTNFVEDRKRNAQQRGMIAYGDKFMLPWCVEHIQNLYREIEEVQPCGRAGSGPTFGQESRAGAAGGTTAFGDAPAHGCLARTGDAHEGDQ